MMIELLPIKGKSLHETLLYVSSAIGEQKENFRYLEIGFRIGDSCRSVLKSDKVGYICIVDIFQPLYGGIIGKAENGKNRVTELMKTYKHTDYDLKIGNSMDILPQMVSENPEPFDLILVDADHSAEGAFYDLINVEYLLADDGVIVFDDIKHLSHAYLLDVWNNWLVESQFEYNTEISEKGNGVTVSQRITGV